MDGTRAKDYLYSLPERLVRSLSGFSGGVALQLGDVLLPARVRRSACTIRWSAPPCASSSSRWDRSKRRSPKAPSRFPPTF
jgi:hypothetical protein